MSPAHFVKPDHAAEAALVKEVLAGRKQVFADLIRLYQDRIYAMAMGYFRNPEEAKDVTQEVFLAVYCSLPRFDLSRPFRAWILRIATHHCIDHLRRKTRPPVRPDPVAHELDPLDIQLQEEARTQVRGCLNVLSEEYYSVIMLYYYGELSCHDIAESLGISVSLVKVRLLRARRLMAQAIVGKQ